jgi:hypothetical protein
MKSPSHRVRSLAWQRGASLETVTMGLKQNKWFIPGGLACGLLFGALLLVRTGLLPLPSGPAVKPLRPAGTLAATDRWMAILQGTHKIGLSHSRLEPTAEGYRLQEQVTMRINTMGLVQDLVLESRGWLNPDLTLQRFTFRMHSGIFTFEAEGRVENRLLVGRIRSGGSERRLRLPLEAPPYLPAGIFPALAHAGLAPGARRVFPIFDPSTMAQEDITLTLQGREIVSIGKDSVTAWKVNLAFKGVTQDVWLDDDGEVLMEKGLLDIRQVRVSREDALSGTPVTAGDDLTRVAAVAADRPLPDPTGLTRLTLQLEGIDLDRYHLDGGRQQLHGNRLTLSREDLAHLPAALPPDTLPPEAAALLAPSPFVQSDHPKIKALADQLVNPQNPPLANLDRLVGWMQTHIDKRPVLSVPDALSTLEKGVGDCNEHAVLLAALARAAGYPAEVEAGLVYHEGRFFYHAWNRVYLGRWITVDALFGQIPADVTHIRFSRGTTREQLDLLPLLGNLKIRVIGMK